MRTFTLMSEHTRQLVWSGVPGARRQGHLQRVSNLTLHDKGACRNGQGTIREGTFTTIAGKTCPHLLLENHSLVLPGVVVTAVLAIPDRLHFFPAI